MLGKDRLAEGGPPSHRRVAAAKAAFGTHLTLYLPRVGELQVPITSYKVGDGAMLLAEFKHPITKELLVAGFNAFNRRPEVVGSSH